jgi:hypothetical protein
MHNGCLFGTAELPAPSLHYPQSKESNEGKGISTCMQALLLEEVLHRAEELAAISADQGHVPLRDLLVLIDAGGVGDGDLS